MRRSVFLPHAFFVASLYVDCYYTTNSMCLTPPLDASAWVEILLDLVRDIVAY